MLLSPLNEPSDNRVYLIHILINMKPHFLLLGALGEDIIHQALSPVLRFLFTQSALSAWLSLTLISLSYPLPVVWQIIKARRGQTWRIKDGSCICALLGAKRNIVRKKKKKIHGRGLKSSQAARFTKLPKIASKGRRLLVDVGKGRIDHQFFLCVEHFTSRSAPFYSHYLQLLWCHSGMK